MTLGRAIGAPASQARAIKSPTSGPHAAAEVAAPLRNDRHAPSASGPAAARGKFGIRGSEFPELTCGADAYLNPNPKRSTSRPSRSRLSRPSLDRVVREPRSELVPELPVSAGPGPKEHDPGPKRVTDLRRTDVSQRPCCCSFSGSARQSRTHAATLAGRPPRGPPMGEDPGPRAGPSPERRMLPVAMTRALRELWIATSHAVHGEEISEPQFRFIREVGPQVLSALRGL